MRRILFRGPAPIAAALLALAAAAPQGAAACTAPEIPCEAGGGVYHMALPTGSRPHKAVIFLHGYGGRGDRTIANKGLVRPLLSRGYAVIAPQGAPRREGDKGGAWNAFAAPSRRDDVAFLTAVAEDAAARGAIRRDEVLLAGFSGGGMMVWRVACDAPGTFSAYAPVAGLLWRPLPETCAGKVRMLHVHGWTDRVVPLEGRSVAGGRFTQGDLFAGLALVRRANGCDRDDPDAMETAGRFRLRSWTACAPGSALELALHDGGHRVPRGWGDLALDWFEALPDGPS